MSVRSRQSGTSPTINIPSTRTKASPIAYARSPGAIGILSGLSPAGNLFGVEVPLTAEGAQIRAAQARGLYHGRQVVSSAPLLRKLGGGRHQLTLFLQLAAPFVERLGGNPGGAGHLGDALPVGRAHALADRIPHSGVIGRFHGRRFGPLADGSDRADNFSDAGLLTPLAFLFLFLVCVTAMKLVEKPGILLGRRVLRLLRAKD